MTRLLGLAAAILAGCTSITYRDEHGEWTRTSFGTDLQLQRITVRVGADGSRDIEADGVSSTQTQALEKVAEGAARGAAAGLKP